MALSEVEKQRKAAGEANAKREKALLENGGAPTVRHTDPTTFEVTEKQVEADEPQRIGNFTVSEDTAESKS